MTRKRRVVRAVGHEETDIGPAYPETDERVDACHTRSGQGQVFSNPTGPRRKADLPARRRMMASRPKERREGTKHSVSKRAAT